MGKNDLAQQVLAYRFKYTKIVLMIALAIIMPLNCSQTSANTLKTHFYNKQNRMRREYIIALTKSGNMKIIRRLFAHYHLESISKITHGVYLIKIQFDPGPSEIKKIGEKSLGIKYTQPNNIYRASKQKIK